MVPGGAGDDRLVKGLTAEPREWAVGRRRFVNLDAMD
jgi:hypothetical protein